MPIVPAGIWSTCGIGIPKVSTSPSNAAYAAERYSQGVSEDSDWPNVPSGFLMPVLVGQFDPERPRHTFEQPTRAWIDDLHAAGWAAHVTSLAPCRRADAVLFDARPAGQPPAGSVSESAPSRRVISSW